ncbi:MAG: response regulator transcription factor [Bacteroidia bacterium]|nr:response regulator transcription factor [Bacteroidia bacterium]
MKCIIVDDEVMARQLMRAYAEKVPGLEVVAECGGSISALKALREHLADLILLDINMPDLSGFELIDTLAEVPMVIIISAYPEYALEGYQWDIVDYLVKPVSFDRFVKAVNKAEKLYDLKQKAEAQASEEEAKDHFFVRDEHRMEKVRFTEILYVESFREYAHIHTNGKKVIVKRPLKSLEEVFEPGKFMRVHRSFIIALDKIEVVFGNRIVIGETEIPIGKSYKEEFFKTIELL